MNMQPPCALWPLLRRDQRQFTEHQEGFFYFLLLLVLHFFLLTALEQMTDVIFLVGTVVGNNRKEQGSECSAAEFVLKRGTRAPRRALVSESSFTRLVMREEEQSIEIYSVHLKVT